MTNMGLHNQQHFNAAERKTSGPSVVIALLLTTLGVFALQMLTRQPGQPHSQVFQWLALEQHFVLGLGQGWRLLTYAFCHSEESLTHIAFNMLALFFLGRVVAHTIGDREFLWMYLSAAFFAGIVQVTSMTLLPAASADWALGASGAVSAVFVIFTFHYPKLKLHLFGMVPVQARMLLLAVAAYDLLGFLDVLPSVFVPSGPKVGHAAHLGGMIFGYFYFRWDMRITRWWDIFAKRVKTVELQRAELRVFNPVEQPEVDYSDRLDHLLQKISVQGEESLTPRERRVLSQASDHLRKSRT